MLEFLSANSSAIITGVCGIIGIIISSITSVIVTKKKCQNDGNSSLQEENKRLQEELKLLKDVDAIDKTLDKTHGSIYYETMPNGSRRSLCGYCWEQSHKRIPLKTHNSYNRPHSLSGFCQVCKAHCNDTLEPQNDYSETQNERYVW